MKKTYHLWTSPLFAAIFLLFSAQPLRAKADVYVPPEDSFYRKHTSQCTPENRLYIANGPGGELIFYYNPESTIEVSKTENGRRVFVEAVFTHDSGTTWGYAHVPDRREGAWFPMDYVYPAFDDAEFQKLYPVESVGGELEGEEGMTVRFWNYPGGEITGNAEPGGDESLGYELTYTDEEGRRWGHVGYYYGQRNRWICLDAPGASEEELYPEGKPVRDTREIAEPDSAARILPAGTPRRKIIGTVTAAVAAVTALSAVLLVWMRRKRGGGEEAASSAQDADSSQRRG